MNLEELQAARDRERQTDKLQQLRESFYADAGEFIQQLRAERERAAERVDDPFDAPEVNQLTDEINTAEQTVEAIYEKRVGKIVKAASFAAADLPAESEGMTAEEQELFDTLVEDIKRNRQHVLDILAGEETEQNETGQGMSAPEPDVSAADLMGTGEESTSTDTPAISEGDSQAPKPQSEQSEHAPPEHGNEGPAQHAAGKPEQDQSDRERDHDASLGASGTESPETETVEAPGGATHQGDAVRNDGGQLASRPQDSSSSTAGTTTEEPPTSISRETVRITDDIDTFVGSDERDYDLQQDDVVTLPESNATLLIERDAAEHL